MTRDEAKAILAAEVTRLGPRSWRVNSATIPGAWWTVVRMGASLMCSCPDAMYGHKRCWHGLAVKAWLELKARGLLGEQNGRAA